MPFTPSSLQTFPDEILLMIFSEADIPTLLSLSNVCKKFRRLSNVCLADKFKEENVGLNLTFGQEHKLRSNVKMEFHHVDETNGNFVFQPKEEDIQLKYYHSPMLKSPKIYKVALHDTTQAITQKDANLIQKSVGFSVKSREGNHQKIQYVYRTGYLKVPFKFIYSIIDIPPVNDSKSRGGERWVTPLSFECPPSFFYPNDAAVHRIFKSMINYKPTIKKQQQSIKNSTISNTTIKQKQIQRTSFSQEPQVSQIQEPILQIEVIHEKKKLFMMPLVSSRRFNLGARS
ncbi:hypothetical protein RhiirA5_421829 [Rhizophagus irregularis]|uniref:F-box domain-containing protein n=3 Tax=Rhizophagus irregularis TaxID=588596 RepID=A0A2I1EYI8_9GLOM|nr:hypothetical protein GLOIN_2v1576388 [Rhizophagus irregularis DAOM 181602=DAOM 197198]EXX68560.1 hypothetical protein RirG_104120 [Rhizophagus irregularis DAOM 197198w]PKC04750.1 hypothetical protein RhiirA5_421829 [Rhizophagus irregularis]PKY27186.1 hypothetical protein RhiirB3_477886 [Rhizophagus irregularis]POG74354.1 hypothetical protein GLOIN_2v1576388 [Rhizophagus irregularis DAOM 181602=DAOM 197198]UZO29103.1 hypothetical protein OCT59_022593 [Rhizophagus irregularis]|eukprot:XP_025181220.1 hypothetical protein GLOIN_2v1576388 [Rhizophagus irregularis DAOM 181602=DAOM 197198]